MSTELVYLKGIDTTHGRSLGWASRRDHIPAQNSLKMSQDELVYRAGMHGKQDSESGHDVSLRSALPPPPSFAHGALSHVSDAVPA